MRTVLVGMVSVLLGIVGLLPICLLGALGFIVSANEPTPQPPPPDDGRCREAMVKVMDGHGIYTCPTVGQRLDRVSEDMVVCRCRENKRVADAPPKPSEPRPESDPEDGREIIWL
jgi:hypothetical protein